MDALGQFEGRKPNARHFSFAADGKYLFLYLTMNSLPLSFSVLPAISLHGGVLHCEIIEGSFCTATFSRFIENLLDEMQPYPEPNSVIVMDNCRIHRHPDIEHMIKER